MKTTSGRRRYRIWELFENVPLVATARKKTHPDVICKHCQKILKNAQPGRSLAPHVFQCEAIPAPAKAQYLMPFVYHSTNGICLIQRGRRRCVCPCKCGARPRAAKTLRFVVSPQ